MNRKCVGWRLKLRQNSILYFYFRGLRLPKSSSCRLARTNKKVGKCYLWRLKFKTKIRILQSANLLDYDFLTSIFFKPNVSIFEGSNCFLRFILDPPLTMNQTTMPSECDSSDCYKEHDDSKWKIFKKGLAYFTFEYQYPTTSTDKIFEKNSSFMWNSTLQEKFNFYFQGVFC